MTLNQQKLWRLIYFEKTFMKLRDAVLMNQKLTSHLKISELVDSCIHRVDRNSQRFGFSKLIA